MTKWALGEGVGAGNRGAQREGAQREGRSPWANGGIAASGPRAAVRMDDGPTTVPTDDGDALDAYSRTVSGVAERVLPSVASLTVATARGIGAGSGRPASSRTSGTC